MLFKLISWKPNKRPDAARQMRALAERRPHIIALQEVTGRTVGGWIEALRAEGFAYVRATVADSSKVPDGPHASGVLIASRYPFGNRARVSFEVPSWREKVLSLLVETPLGELAMHNVHVPNGSDNDWEKVHVLEAVFIGLSGRRWNQHTVLCGDFNTPQCELSTGQIITWAQYEDDEGRFRLARRITGGSALRWDAAERNILSGLQLFGMRDVFRSLHGYEVEACSWLMRRTSGSRPRRFDHIFASDRLKTMSCEYVTAWRESGLSDHAAIEAVFEA
jgi:exodeoxyribonuclease-3